MSIDPDKVRTQEDENEPAPIDKIEERVQAEMKRIEGSAQERAGQGMQDEELENEGRKLKEEGEKELEEQRGDH
ncbi:MAG: hypothetical protein WBV94_18935 [Blastocatellia bacterium]